MSTATTATPDTQRQTKPQDEQQSSAPSSGRVQLRQGLRGMSLAEQTAALAPVQQQPADPGAPPPGAHRADADAQQTNTVQLKKRGTQDGPTISAAHHKPQSVVFNPYAQQNSVASIQSVLDTFVNDRGESLFFQFSIDGHAYVQLGWFPAYIAASITGTAAYEMCQDFTCVLAAGFDLMGKFGIGKALKGQASKVDPGAGDRGVSGAAGVSLTGGYAYQWEFSGSKAVAGSIYNMLVKINQWISEDSGLSAEQKANCYIKTEGSEFVDAGAKKQLEVTSLGAGVFAQGGGKAGGGKGGGASVDATWSSTRTKHMDEQDPDGKGTERHSSESAFSVEAAINVSLNEDWAVGGSLSYNQSTVFGDPNANMNGKFHKITIAPQVTISASKCRELLKSWGVKGLALFMKAAMQLSSTPGMADVPVSEIERALKELGASLKGSAAQIESAVPKNDKAWESAGQLVISPVGSLMFREEEKTGRTSKWNLQVAKLFLDVKPGFGGEKETKTGGIAVGASGGGRFLLGAMIGTDTLSFIRQTFVDAPEKDGKKPAWLAFKSSNQTKIATAIYNCVWYDGKGPSQVESAGNSEAWRALFNRMKSSGADDMERWVADNAPSLITDLEKCFDVDAVKIAGAEKIVRDFVDRLSRIEEDLIKSHHDLDWIIDELRRQHNAGGKPQIDKFLELCSSYGADVSQILSTLGQYWGPAAASWFKRWGVPYREHHQRATEPKLPQYQRLGEMANARLGSGDGLGIQELFIYAHGDGAMRQELESQPAQFALKKSGFQSKFGTNYRPELVLVHMLEIAGGSFETFMATWDAQDDAKGGQTLQLCQMKVLRILVNAGYAFGGESGGGQTDEKQKRLQSSLAMYSERSSHARKVLLNGPRFVLGYTDLDRRYVYELFESSGKDNTLREARQVLGSESGTETNPVKWFYEKTMKGVPEDHMVSMLKYPPPGMSLYQVFTKNGVPYNDGS